MRISDWSSDVCSSDLGNQLCGGNAHADAKHAMPGRQPCVTVSRRAADDRHVVDADRSPAEPFLALHRPDRFVQVLRRAAFERVEPAPVERAVVAGEFHRAAEPVAAVPGRHADAALVQHQRPLRSEEHTSELQSLMRISYAVFCLKKKQNTQTWTHTLL